MVAAASKLNILNDLPVSEEFLGLFAQMGMERLLSPRQLFPLSGVSNSFLDIGIWNGVTEHYARQMMGYSLLIQEERKEKDYKAWITCLLDTQAWGSNNATPGFLSKMNPNYIRWGVEPPTRDKYAGAGGQLLAWGFMVQKVRVQQRGILRSGNGGLDLFGRGWVFGGC
jgi:hypothetical protein